MSNRSFPNLFRQGPGVGAAGQPAGLVAAGLVLVLLTLACSSGPLAMLVEPTPAQSSLAIEVTVIVHAGLDDTGADSSAGRPIAPTRILSLGDSSATPQPLPTDTPLRPPTEEPTLPAQPTAPQPASTPILPAPSPSFVEPTAESTAVASDAETGFQTSPKLPFSGSINIIVPEERVILPATIDQLEVKWIWRGTDQKLGRCETLEEYGFEVRIDPPQPYIGPLGVMDAAKNEEDRAQGLYGCDPETGLHTYLITFLKDKPGVKSACGEGKFLVDVALVQLEPYEPILTSQAYIFEITPNYQGSLDPFGEPLTCSEFMYWVEAQGFFYKAGGPSKDPHNLDPDGNGRACDDLCTPE